MIWAPEFSFPALYYVVEEQGEPMALYYDKKFYDQFDRELSLYTTKNWKMLGGAKALSILNFYSDF